MKLRFSIRDLLSLAVVAALATGWWLDDQSLAGLAEMNLVRINGNFRLTQLTKEQMDQITQARAANRARQQALSQ